MTLKEKKIVGKKQLVVPILVKHLLRVVYEHLQIEKYCEDIVNKELLQLKNITAYHMPWLLV